MSPGARKAALTVHVACSVGWVGAVCAFLALALAGITSDDGQLVRGAYLAMELTGWYVLVPLSFASLLSGIIQSLGTSWGLFRYYWLVVKLVLTVLATVVLLVHMQAVDSVASEARGQDFTSADLAGVRVQLVGDAAAALLVLLVATALSVFKPRGMTRYGWRQQRVGPARRLGVESDAPLDP